MTEVPGAHVERKTLASPTIVLNLCVPRLKVASQMETHGDCDSFGTPGSTDHGGEEEEQDRLE